MTKFACPCGGTVTPFGICRKCGGDVNAGNARPQRIENTDVVSHADGGVSGARLARSAALASGGDDLISRREALAICESSAATAADYALDGEPDNARSREAMEATATRIAHQLRALRPRPAAPAVADVAGALEALRNGQRQLDADGVEVGVSRQALDEVLAALAQQPASVDQMCQWCQGSGESSNTLNDPGPCFHCDGKGYIALQHPRPSGERARQCTICTATVSAYPEGMCCHCQELPWPLIDQPEAKS